MEKNNFEELERISNRLDGLIEMLCDARDSMYREAVDTGSKAIYKRWSQIETLCEAFHAENTSLYQIVKKEE